MNKQDVKYITYDMTEAEAFAELPSFSPLSYLYNPHHKGDEDIKTAYINVPAAFDIETSSFYRRDPPQIKQANMYIWTLAIGFNVIHGRTWDEFRRLLDLITDANKLDEGKRLVIYVHNLSYEFQFFRRLLKWKSVFSIREREPLYCLTTSGLEFRCSYKLSNSSLDAVAKNLTTYNISKLKGDLDYSLLRHSETELTSEEMGYIDNDVLILICYIYELIAECHGVAYIPLTQTGFVRKYCKNATLYRREGGKKYRNLDYFDLMRRLTLTPEIYQMCKEALQGGFVHAAAMHCNKTLRNVGSADFISDYPARMVSELFPMSEGTIIYKPTAREFEELIKKYHCIFTIEFRKISARIDYDHILSSSKCLTGGFFTLDNGRIVDADRVRTTITELDFEYISKFYRWERAAIVKLVYFKRGLLPRELVLAILKLYNDKTKLKNVKGSEREYMRSKEKLNACYGMTVTDIVRDIVEYDQESGRWSTRQNPNIEGEIKRYNKKAGRFLFYPWGVYVTAYARKYIYDYILAVKWDHVYSDTDSGKFLHPERHAAYFEKYNAFMRQRLELVSLWQNIPFELFEPETIKGEKKLIGAWELERPYSYFKTLGAKRYIFIRNKKPNFTVSGLNSHAEAIVRKQGALYYMLKECRGSMRELFDFFADSMTIPEEWTGKNTHTYIDFETAGTLTDYQGKTAPYSELSSLHLEAAPYVANMGVVYLQYLRGIRQITI